MSANPIERVALDAIEFIEDLTADPLLDSEDVEMRLEDVQAHAGIEAASLRKRLSAALEAEASEGEREHHANEARLARLMGLLRRIKWNRHRRPELSDGGTEAAFEDIFDMMFADALDAALIPAPAREGWQPIGTAPKDGTRFLALEGRRHFDCWWHWFGADQVYNWQDDADSEPDPTHWMPLPSPPQDREEQ